MTEIILIWLRGVKNGGTEQAEGLKAEQTKPEAEDEDEVGLLQIFQMEQVWWILGHRKGVSRNLENFMLNITSLCCNIGLDRTIWQSLNGLSILGLNARVKYCSGFIHQ